MIHVGDLRLGFGDRIAINDVFLSSQISPGNKVKKFEEAFSRRHGCEFGVMTNSGTDALRVALATLKEVWKWNDGDEVLVPSVTFVATVNVVLQLNLKPVPIDVQIDGNMDPDCLRAYLEGPRKRTKGLIVAHLFGRPASMPRIMALANAAKLKVIEDSCETVGMVTDGKSVGSWGDIGCFSFYAAHILTTGVGGMATTNDPRYGQVMRSYVNHGRDPAYIPGASEAELTKEFLKKRFRFERLGYSCRPTEFEAAIGLVQLENLDQMIAKRRKNAAQLIERLSDPPLDLPNLEGSAFMMFPVLIKESCKADKWDLCLHLERRGIETREMLPLNQPCYEGLFDVSRCPMAERFARGGFYIGCHPYLTPEDHDNIWAAFRDFNWKP